QHLVDEGNRVGERELQPAAAAAAEEAAAASAAKAAVATEAAASAATGRRTTFRGGTTLRRRSGGRTALLPARTAASGKPELLPELVEHRGRWTFRLQRLGEIE